MYFPDDFERLSTLSGFVSRWIQRTRTRRRHPNGPSVASSGGDLPPALGVLMR
jgi:hypothetical protein